MLSHRFKTRGVCLLPIMSNPVSILRRVKNQFMVFDLKSIEGCVSPQNLYQRVPHP